MHIIYQSIILNLNVHCLEKISLPINVKGSGKILTLWAIQFCNRCSKLAKLAINFYADHDMIFIYKIKNSGLCLRIFR